jgi:rhodanese-related sulfurtransferase
VAGRVNESRAPTRRFHVPSAVRASPARIDAATARELIANGALLVDVRRHDDPAMTLERGLRVPPDEIPERIDEFSRDTPIVLACG